MKNFNSGFSLIELSILITAASIITATFLMLTQAQTGNDINKVLLTQKNLLQVKESIVKFRDENGRLPCPADITQPIENKNAENLDLNTMNCNLNFGSIPIGSLGIDRKLMLDGWGRKIYYYVSSDLCSAPCTAGSYTSGAGNITVNNTDTSSTISLTANGAYVLLSHGASGQGAYLADGNPFLANTTNPNKEENFNNDNTFIQNSYYQDFDDILIYQTKTQLENSLYDPGLNLVSQTLCTDNATYLASIDQNAAINSSTSLRNQLPYTTITDPVSGISYNRGDEAVLEIMWVLQEICYKLYNTPKVCPGNVTYQSTTSTSCTCYNKSWENGC